MLTVERIEDIAVFETLKEEWSELLETSASNCLFLTWEWLFTWWKHLAEDRRLHILAVRCNGELAALAPFTLRPRRLKRLLPFPALEFLGSGIVGSDYLDILVRRGEERRVLPALAGCLAEEKRVLELSQVERTARHAVEFALELRQRSWTLSRTTTDYCPFINLAGHRWESYRASLGRAHRYNFRRRLKNLTRRFDVRFEQVRSEEQRGEAMRLLVVLHSLRWRERGGSGAFNTSALVAFHEELSRLALRRGWLRVYVLRLDGKPAAALYGFHYNGVFYFYQSGFDPEFRKYSVGLVTMGLAIKSAIEGGAEIYDFLHGDERYKFLWARDERELVRLRLYPPSASGALYRQTMELRWGIKKILWRHFPSTLSDIG
jgi:CelD/BcsL family acetyltransferase involved in cellulose biosynthesis